MIQSAGNQESLLPVFLLHSKSTCTQGLEAKAVTSRPRSAACRSLMWWGVVGCESKLQPTREEKFFFLSRFQADFSEGIVAAFCLPSRMFRPPAEDWEKFSFWSGALEKHSRRDQIRSTQKTLLFPPPLNLLSNFSSKHKSQGDFFDEKEIHHYWSGEKI